MCNGVAAQIHARGISTIVMRSSQSPTQTDGVPKKVAIGLILGVIILGSCTIMAFLVRSLVLQHRKERSQLNRLDLLEDASFSTTGSEDTETGSPKVRCEKDLPRLPSSISVYGFPKGRHSSSVSRHSVHASTREVPIIRLSSPAVDGKQDVPNASNDQGGSHTGSSLALSHSRSATISSLERDIVHPSTIDGSITHPPSAVVLGREKVEPNVFNDHHPSSSFTGSSEPPSLERDLSRSNSNALGAQSSTAPVVRRGQFAVVNVTEVDVPHLQLPQSVHGQLPEYHDRVRGRHQPFPAKTDRKAQDPSMVTLELYNTEPGHYNVSLTAPTSEKQGAMDVPSPDPPFPGPSYTVHLPPSTHAGRSNLAPPRPRLPLTIMASRPLSNITVERMGTIRRLNGTQGKSRMVTMSVMVEESETSNSDVDPLDQRRESSTSSDILGQVVERYANESDLPPYTPREETML